VFYCKHFLCKYSGYLKHLICEHTFHAFHCLMMLKFPLLLSALCVCVCVCVCVCIGLNCEKSGLGRLTDRLGDPVVLLCQTHHFILWLAPVTTGARILASK
jgi:hypothetical protein